MKLVEKKKQLTPQTKSEMIKAGGSIMINHKVDDEVVTVSKPIRPTTAIFGSSTDKKEFDCYAMQQKKTESVGMDNIREMIRDYHDK
ncbi:hypothetical protein NV379_02705 [Paenibacillus sp. N1-5-1-14]|nr:hypothetical protein [Paenibacillus radicibacter]